MKNIIKGNKITKIEKFDEKLEPIIDIDTKGMYNINELYTEICTRHKILKDEIDSVGRFL